MKNMILERQADGSYLVAAPEPEPETKAEMKQELTFSEEELAKLISLRKEKTANMETSGFGGIGATLDKVTGMQIMDIPIGEAAVGGALAIVLDRLIIARLDPKNTWGSWANLGLAFVVKKWGSKFMGNKTADATALILTYEAIADWVTQAINKVVPASGTSKQVFSKSFEQDFAQNFMGGGR